MIRPLQRDEPFLTKALTKSEEAGSHTARREQNSRAIERQLYEELSRRYPAGGLRWTRPRLLSRGKQKFLTDWRDIPLTRVFPSHVRSGESSGPSVALEPKSITGV